MFNIVYNGNRSKDSGQYYVEVIVKTFNEYSSPENLTPRLGFWCDVPHLRTLQRSLNSMIGPPPNVGKLSGYGDSDEEVIDEFVNLIGPLSEHKEIQSKHDMMVAIAQAKLPAGKPYFRNRNASGEYTGRLVAIDRQSLSVTSDGDYHQKTDHARLARLAKDDVLWADV